MFRKLEGDSVLLRQGGVYKSSELYAWQGGLYARAAGGYIRLRANGTTTKGGVLFTHIETLVPLYADPFQRLAVEPGDGFTPLALDHRPDGTRLLPAP